MVENLMEMMQSSLTPRVAGDVSTYLGESPSITRQAVTAAIPAVLTRLAQQSSTLPGATKVFEAISSPQIDAGLAENPGGWLGGGAQTADLLSKGNALLRDLFRDRTGDITEAISSVSGMKMASASTVLSLTVPAIFAWLKRHVARGGLDAAGLAGVLGGQGEHLQSRLDDRVTSALGFATPAALVASLAPGVTGHASAAAGRIADAARDVGSGAARAVDTATAAAAGALQGPEPLTRRGWFWGVLAAIALLFLAGLSYWATTVDTTARTAGPAAARAVRSLELPGGAKIDVTAGGFVDSLAAFLASKDATARSFTFDDLHFETGSATLTPASDRQLTALAAVLGAYGDVSVHVAGYTDNTGDPAANRRLSADRAAAVKQALVVRGVPASRIADEGFGPDSPIAPNDTEEGRSRNRRVELGVVKR